MAPVGLTSKASSTVSTPQVRAELMAFAPQGVQKKQVLWVGLQLAHQPQWHTYWKNSGDSGLPTALQWTLPKGITAGEIAWPTPKKIPIGPLANYGYEGTVLLPVPLKLDASFKPGPFDQDITIGLYARWLVCKLECIPEEGYFEIKLPIKSSTALNGAVFEQAFAQSPKPFVARPGVSGIAIDQQHLLVSVAGLPAAWQGKPLDFYPETPEITTPTAPVVQNWKNGVWVGQVQLAKFRAADPAALPFVLAQGSQNAVRVTLPIKGQWPAAEAQTPLPLPGTNPSIAPPIAPSTTPALPGAGTALNPLPPSFEVPSKGAAPGFGLGLALAGALLGGLLLNLMPCVFPVLAIKVLHLAKSELTPAERHHAGLAYTAGVLVSVLALAGGLLALRAAGESLGWGFQLQNAWVVAGLAALFVVIAVNLLGGFEVGQWVPQRLAGLQVKRPSVDAFLTGVLAVVVASPCSAPFMGAAMGLALTVPTWQGLLIFAALGLGLASPFLLVGFVPAVARFLPKPGAWMDNFKRALAFPMLATTAWLVWVLGQQNGMDAAGALLVVLIALAFFLWALATTRQLAQQGGTALGRSVALWLATALVAVVLFIFLPYVRPAAMPADGNASPTPSSAQEWQSWSPDKQAALLAAGQAVFVDYTAAWCVTCQFNKKTTLTDPEVLAAFKAKGVQLLRADWTRPNPVIAQSITELGRSGVPVYVLQTKGKPPLVLPELLSKNLVLAELAKL